MSSPESTTRPSEAYPHVCADPGACTLPTCREPRRDGWLSVQVLCVRCGSTGPYGWCVWCDAPVEKEASGG